MRSVSVWIVVLAAVAAAEAAQAGRASTDTAALLARIGARVEEFYSRARTVTSRETVRLQQLESDFRPAGLARLLECNGLTSRALARLPTAEVVEIAARERDAILCLSALDSRAAPVRHLVLRLRVNSPRRRIVVGFWGADAARLLELRMSLAIDAGVELVASLEEAVALLGGPEPGEVSLPASPVARDGRGPGTC